MMMSTEAMKSLLKERGKLVESYLATCLDGQEMPPRLRESMLYSLQAGGKRLRPVPELCRPVRPEAGGRAALRLRHRDGPYLFPDPRRSARHG